MASQFPENPQPVAPDTGMVARAKRVLFEPKAEWPRIDAGPATAQSVFRSWVVPLAAIGPIAGLIGQQVFGYGAWIVHFRPSLTFSITSAVLGYIMALIGAWVLALVIDALAPNFGGTRNQAQAMKVAAYGGTAAYLAGIFQLIPMLAILGVLLSLYSLYLLWLGLPLLMKVAQDKAPGYAAAVVIAAIVIFIVVMAVTRTIAGSLLMPPTLGSISSASGTVSIPGVGSIDTAKIDAASKQMEAAAATVEQGAKTGTTNTVAPDTLQAMLPGAVGGWVRTSLESSGGSAAGIGGSRAEGEYTQGDNSFRLTVTDMGAMGTLATMGGALNVQSSKQTATGYEKTAMDHGNMVTERWDSSDHSGKYGTMIASRFMVEAEGSAPDISPLKAAVASVDAGKLARLAH